MIFAILPVKSLKNAKQRLREAFDAEERERLARLLFRRTLGELCRATAIDRVVVVTSDEEVADHARAADVTVFEEKEQVSHSTSADAACRRAQEMGATTALLVPIDLPLVTAADFNRLALSAAADSGPQLIVVPSMDGTGTNALVRIPPDVIESQFGPGSCRAHLAQAETKGIRAELLRLEGLMFDIDTPEDVAELLSRNADSTVSELLRSLCASK